MAAGAGARNGEIQHLAGKDEGPSTPMSGTSRISFSCLTLRAQSVVIAAEAAHMVQPTAGEMKPSAICMMLMPFY